MRHRVGRVFLMPLRYLGRIALRVIVGGLIFMACLTVMSSLGLPVPGLHELLDKFKDVSRLAEILS